MVSIRFRTTQKRKFLMASNGIERIVTLAASVVTLWSVWTASPTGAPGPVVFLDSFLFGPRLVAVFLIDACIVWVLSKMLLLCLGARLSHVAFVLSIAVLATNSWQSVYLFHVVLFHKAALSTLETILFGGLQLCSASLFGLLLHSHFKRYSGRFFSPFHIPRGRTWRYDLFLFGKTGTVGVSILSYIPFTIWALIEPNIFYH